MCGIVGEHAAARVVSAPLQLEVHGYDSAGAAWYSRDKMVLGVGCAYDTRQVKEAK